MAEKKERQKSFAGRLIRVWVLGIAVPLIAVELLFLVQFYRINSREAEENINNTLNRISQEMMDLMDNMKMVSWLLEKDGTVGKNLEGYLAEEDTDEKFELLTYLRGQIANYEISNSSVGNLTYLYFPVSSETPIKINQTSLANGEMPAEENFLCSWESMDFYGPHDSKSVAAQYPCISMLRRYDMPESYGEMYIYVESGYRYLDRLDLSEIEELSGRFLIESADGRVMYQIEEGKQDFTKETYAKVLESSGGRYKICDREMKGGWKLHIWVPNSHYYRMVYGMALNMALITLLVVLACILFSVWQWRNIYKTFDRFSTGLKQIAEGNEVEEKVQRMNIREFDENFAVLGKMQKNILLLLNRVQEEEKRRQQLEVRVVLGKINPHFLYNTLDTLKWYAAGKGDREMMRFITALNRLLLYNMSKEEKTTLKEELEAIRSYIVLQELKYDLDTEIDTGKHPEILQTEMPRFILQPIVENAIRHSGSDKGIIRIQIELLANGKISILVKNSGNPIDPEKIRQVLEEKRDVSQNGIGLQYVARMLESSYGMNFGLRAERTEDGFNVVEIRIPFEARKIRRQAGEETEHD